MVREEERVGDDGPCGIPGELLLVEQDAHQLGDRERRVRVVQLDRDVCVRISISGSAIGIGIARTNSIEIERKIDERQLGTRGRGK